MFSSKQIKRVVWLFCITVCMHSLAFSIDQNKKALILVDIQNCFLPGGSLAIKDSIAIIPIANQLIALKGSYFDLVIATKDWHPANHVSFAENHPGKKAYDAIQIENTTQVLWPAHCVQNTNGAKFPPSLNTKPIDYVQHKGRNPKIDSYSGFFDNRHLQATGLEDYLKKKGIKEIYVMGLATDYCVKHTALDGKSLGFITYFILNGSRGVNAHATDVNQSIKDMKKAGVQIINSKDILLKTQNRRK